MWRCPTRSNWPANSGKWRSCSPPFAAEVEVAPILGMEQPFHYRDKVISPYAPGRLLKGATVGREDAGRSGAGARGNDRSGKGPKGAKGAKGSKAAPREILTGMYERGSHRLIPAEKCLAENETAKQVTLAIRDIMARWDIASYSEDAGTGFVRHAVVRVGHESGEVLVTLVTDEEAFPAFQIFLPRAGAPRAGGHHRGAEHQQPPDQRHLGREGAGAVRARLHFGHPVRPLLSHLVEVVLPGELHANRGAVQRRHGNGAAGAAHLGHRRLLRHRHHRAGGSRPRDCAGGQEG